MTYSAVEAAAAWRDLDEKFAHDSAWRMLDGKFTSDAPGRFFSGVAMSHPFVDAEGDVIKPLGLRKTTTPVLLLLEHNWSQPCGRVTDIRVSGEKNEKLLVTAEVVNLKAWHMEKVWDNVILSRPRIGLSIRFKKSLRGMTLSEVSLTGDPADPGAEIEKVWLKYHYVSLSAASPMLVLRS